LLDRPSECSGAGEAVVMGFLDFLFGRKTVQCPSCGMRGALQAEGRVRCPNPACPNFDPTATGGRARRVATIPKRGNFAPARPLSIRYRNFQGVDRTFTADADAAAWKRNHFVARVTPTGRRIALSRDRIQNLSEVEAAVPKRAEPGQSGPTRRERQVLLYHKKRGSSSPLYEQIRAKYPTWQ